METRPIADVATPLQIDMQLESGEYFLNEKQVRVDRNWRHAHRGLMSSCRSFRPAIGQKEGREAAESD
jgi:hypothetical protein